MKVSFAQTALDDLLDYQDYLAKRAGIAFAGLHISNLKKHCETLTFSPLRGTLRQFSGRDIRFIVYKRRVVISYRVTADEVIIMNFLVK